jgi:hypothetical protein
LIYWIATNITMIPQQMYMLRKYGRPSDVPVTVAERGRAPRGTPPKPAKAVSAPSSSNGSGAPQEAARAVRKPASPPPSARQRQRKKRSGRRR